MDIFDVPTKHIHCDEKVLHAPGDCHYCDLLGADIQQWRTDHKVNFTGEHDPDKYLCPSEYRRSSEVIHRWWGNRPWKNESDAVPFF